MPWTALKLVSGWTLFSSSFNWSLLLVAFVEHVNLTIYRLMHLYFRGFVVQNINARESFLSLYGRSFIFIHLSKHDKRTRKVRRDTIFTQSKRHCHRFDSSLNFPCSHLLTLIVLSKWKILRCAKHNISDCFIFLDWFVDENISQKNFFFRKIHQFFKFLF